VKCKCKVDGKEGKNCNKSWHLGIGFTKVYLLGSKTNSAKAKNLGPYRF
jgi:hypothetical protein